jgi:hypothetical protein
VGAGTRRDIRRWRVNVVGSLFGISRSKGATAVAGPASPVGVSYFRPGRAINARSLLSEKQTSDRSISTGHFQAEIGVRKTQPRQYSGSRPTWLRLGMHAEQPFTDVRSLGEEAIAS